MQVIIFQQRTSATQSAPNKSKIWLLQFRRTGVDFNGVKNSKDCNNQIRLSFNNLKDAIHYAKANNLDYEIIERKVPQIIKKLSK